MIVILLRLYACESQNLQELQENSVVLYLLVNLTESL